jgi:RNA ligase
MTTYLDEILDPSLLGDMLEEGYIQVRYHPEFPYAIYCYTKKTMWDREWNNVTRICRGLIVNEDTSEIIARPFRKFFNYGEPSAPVFGPSDLVEVTDKMDGSLGILYSTPEGLAMATKGSFTSEQAKWATEHLRAEYGHTEWQPQPGVTYCFEIIYPENRIVLDYGDLEALRLLAIIDNKTGRDADIDMYDDPFAYQDWLGRGTFENMSVGWNRPNKEGVVLRRLSDDERLKIKQEDYIELHKVMTGLNERQLWEWLSEGKNVDDILRDLPEEIHSWAKPAMIHLCDLFLNLKMKLRQAWVESRYMDRKEFALFNAGKDPVIKGALFAKYDGNEARVDEILWKALKP